MKNELFYKGFFGLERETLRVDSSGKLAQTPHPFGDDEQVTRDFCENQIELITPVCRSVKEALRELGRLDERARRELEKCGERIWLYSNPPHFESEDEIPVANFTGEHSGKRAYRELLERRYGKRLMLFSGIHFNFSFDDEYLRTLCDESDFKKWRDGFYLRLYKQLSVHSWLLLLLTASSPYHDRSLWADGANGVVRSRYSSIRNSEKGYWNEFIPALDTSTLGGFVESIKDYVRKGALFSASELYLPVRLKPKGINHIDNFSEGISHIELRMFDLDPAAPLGTDERDMGFAHLLIMYLSQQEDFDFTAQLQEKAVLDHRKAALYDLSAVTIDGLPILERAKQILDGMRSFFAEDSFAAEIIGYEESKLRSRPCERIRAEEIYG